MKTVIIEKFNRFKFCSKDTPSFALANYLKLYFMEYIMAKIYSEFESLKNEFLYFNTYCRRFQIERFFGIHISNVGFKATINRFNPPVVFKKFREYIENTLQKKVALDLNWDRSIMEERDLQTFQELSKPNFSFKHLNLDLLVTAALITGKEMGMHKGYEFEKPLTSVSNLPRTTAASYPEYTKKSDPATISKTIDFVNNYLLNPSIETLITQICTIYHRFTVKLSDDLTENKLKFRPVWGSPFSIVLLERIVFGSYIDEFLRISSSSANSIFASAKGRIGVSKDILPVIRGKYNDIFCLDCERMDMHFPSYIHSLFYSTYSCLNRSNNFEKTILKDLMIYSNYTPYCYKNSLIKFTQKGEPSGSLTTTLKNNFYLRTVLNYAALEKTNGKASIGDLACTAGDDGLVSLTLFSDSYLIGVAKRFGLIISKEKSIVVSYDKTLEFVGMFWTYPENAPIQKLSWYVSHICVPSRFYKEKEIPISLLQTYRAISICMGISNGMETLFSLMNGQDIVLNRLMEQYENGEDVFISYVGRDEKRLFERIPLQVILTEGWTAF